MIGLALADAYLEPLGYDSSAKETWNTILIILESHTLLNKFAARRKLYPVTMQYGEMMLSYLKPEKCLAGTLNDMTVEIEDRGMAMPLLNGLLRSFKNLIVLFDSLGNMDRLFTLDLVRSRLLQKNSVVNCLIIRR